MRVRVRVLVRVTNMLLEHMFRMENQKRQEALQELEEIRKKRKSAIETFDEDRKKEVLEVMLAKKRHYMKLPL